jgi:hypothetical protein
MTEIWCRLPKVDIQEAYRAVPVYPSDRRLLGLTLEGTTFIDKVLPFGLRSVPKQLPALTETMLWMLQNRGVFNTIYYLSSLGLPVLQSAAKPSQLP